jgi:hypothetical protein
MRKVQVLPENGRKYCVLCTQGEVKTSYISTEVERMILGRIKEVETVKKFLPLVGLEMSEPPYPYPCQGKFLGLGFDGRHFFVSVIDKPITDEVKKMIGLCVLDEETRELFRVPYEEPWWLFEDGAEMLLQDGYVLQRDLEKGQLELLNKAARTLNSNFLNYEEVLSTIKAKVAEIVASHRK